jgi:hypothetical protein
VISRLDLELQRQLKPVHAPEELWRRIQTGTRAKTVPKGRGVLLASAATAAIVLCYLGFGSDPTRYLVKTASRELAARTDKLDFRSSDPNQIRAWVESHAGIDVPLAGGRSIQFIGVGLLQVSTCLVCVSYRVGGKEGKLVIARGGSGGPKHPSMRHLSYGGANILAWVSAGQTYVIAAPMENLQVTCALCHGNSARSISRIGPAKKLLSEVHLCSRTVNVLPAPGWLASSTAPRWDSAIHLTIERPRPKEPLPDPLRERA